MKLRVVQTSTRTEAGLQRSIAYMHMYTQHTQYTQYTQKINAYVAQARVGAHGAEALVALEGDEELEAADERLVRQSLHACVLGVLGCVVGGGLLALFWRVWWLCAGGGLWGVARSIDRAKMMHSHTHAPGILRTSRCVRLPTLPLGVAAAIVGCVVIIDVCSSRVL